MDISHFIKEAEDRIKLLVKAGEQSIANHNALLGRIEEAKDSLEALLKKGPAAESQEAIDAPCGTAAYRSESVSPFLGPSYPHSPFAHRVPLPRHSSDQP